MGQHKTGKVRTLAWKGPLDQGAWIRRMRARVQRWGRNATGRKADFPPPQHLARVMGWRYVHGKDGQVLFTRR